MLPDELIHVLNEVYFLYVLATEPSKVIPPGKSLLSMMVRSQHRSPPTPDALHDRVEQAVHRAFWNEALESLSSPAPSIQLPRLKALYTDLLDALSPLFPPQHPAIQSLSYPIPPTSSPLHSALALLKEILIALRQRCAPVRDPDIDALLAKIDDNPPPQPSYIHDTSQAHLATLVIDVFRSLITLADTLKSDLTQSVLGMMSEAQLVGVVAQEARVRERELVSEMWGGIENVRVAWRKWASPEEEAEGSIDKEMGRKRWVTKLIKSLALPVPISCVVPDPSSKNVSPPSGTELPTKNELPPQFFFTAPTLFYLQNLLQALVIAASLRSLTRIPPPSLITGHSGSDFMSRVWTLLKSEIDRDVFAIGVGPTRDRGEDPTKIINLADEVIRARRLFAVSGTTSEEEEKALRGAVERTLRPEDPVFLLLMKRMVSAIEGALVRWMVEDVDVRRGGVPERMRAGREVGGRQGLNGVFESGDKKGMEVMKLGLGVSVKGFEDPVLAKGIDDLVVKVIHCVQWTEEVWGDLI